MPRLMWGAGFALYVPEDRVDQVIKIARDCLGQFIDIFHAGYIERSQVKQVTIKPKNITFTSKDLHIR